MHTGFVDKGYEESMWLRARVLKLENVEEKCSIFCASESKLIIRRVYGITFSLSLSVYHNLERQGSATWFCM